MYKILTGETINQLAQSAYTDILTTGRRQDSRNGMISCNNNVIMEIKNPRSRHLYLSGRKSNIAAQIAETLWVMAGDDEIDPFLSFFLPRASDFSDDGKTWRGAYGPRMYMYNQLQDAANVFLTDGMETRQSVVQILLPELDSNEALREQGLEKTKDRPCNNEFVFFCTPNDDGSYNLNMNVFQRSGDAIWGALNINTFEWTFLQELMVANVKNLTGKDVRLGEYTHFVTNLHIYDFTKSQAEEVVKTVQTSTAMREANHTKLIATGSVATDQVFFANLVDALTDLIQCVEEEEFDDIWEDKLIPLMESIDYDSILHDYVSIVFRYIAQKRKFFVGYVDWEKPVQLASADLVRCCEASKFIKFGVCLAE